MFELGFEVFFMFSDSLLPSSVVVLLLCFRLCICHHNFSFSFIPGYIFLVRPLVWLSSCPAYTQRNTVQILESYLFNEMQSAHRRCHYEESSRRLKS